MKKKNIAFLILCGLFAAMLSACLFDSDDTALSSWLNDQGLPDSYKVQTVTIEDLTPVSAEAYAGKTVFSAYDRALLGAQAGLNHDLVLDIAFRDSTFIDSLSKSDSAAAFVTLFVLNPFYSAKYFPADSLPYEETLDLKVEWKLDVGKGKPKAFVDSIKDIKDSAWREELAEWEADNSADTTYELSIGAKDSLVKIPMPSALVEDLKNAGSATHLQLRLSAPDSKRAYRIYGTGSGLPPFIRVKTFSDTTYKNFTAFRMSEVITYTDTCDGCLLLHGGVLDSIVVEYPTDKVLEALSDFYGDAFPFDEGDGYDVRQAVVLAQITFPRDDSEGINELGLPIQVVVGTFIDSLDTEIRKMEEYRLNRKMIVESGHPNLVFFDGDSLSLQVTYGMRDVINQAKSGRNLKMMVRLGYPMLQSMDSAYVDYAFKDSTTGKTDTSYVFFSHFDYARYDFCTSFSKPATLKLWLATKRGGEE